MAQAHERSGSEPIESRSAFQAALREAFQTAGARGCREIWCVDRDFADWPLGEREVIEALTHWAASHRRLVLLAQHFDELPRRHARWVQWRTAWAHVVTCKQVHEEDAAHELPALLLADGLVAVRLHSTELYRGRIYHDPADWMLQREWVDMLEQRGNDTFAATTLGL